jgi:hypothetical protein
VAERHRGFKVTGHRGMTIKRQLVIC